MIFVGSGSGIKLDSPRHNAYITPERNERSRGVYLILLFKLFKIA